MRDAETELLDDIVELFGKWDIVRQEADGMAQDVVDLVKSRLLSPDDMGALDDRISEASAHVFAAVELLSAAKDILPEGVR
jgi:hypothetical protein